MGMLRGCNGFEDDMALSVVKPRAAMRWRGMAALLAFSLGAAACGSTESSTTPTLATQAPSVEVESAEVDAAGPANSADTTETTVPSADETAVEAIEDEETAAPVANLFPDIDVLNIADGGTVNLATELGGGDKATLLWFFAPH